MPVVDILKPIYVEHIPPTDALKQGELYISHEFQTAIHKCCCGCGEEVVTPLNPARWQISEKGGKVSLHPSIGNWSYPCKSHYIISDNRIVWAEAFSEAAIKRVQASDQQALENYIASQKTTPENATTWLKKIFTVLRDLARSGCKRIFRK